MTVRWPATDRSCAGTTLEAVRVAPASFASSFVATSLITRREP